MSRRTILVILFIAIVLIIGIFLAITFRVEEEEINLEPEQVLPAAPSPELNTVMALPDAAKQDCISKGGKVEIRDTAEGTQEYCLLQ